MSRSVCRGAVVAAAVLLASGAIAPAVGATSEKPSDRPRRPRIVATPRPGATGVPLETMISVETPKGRLLRLRVRGPDGAEVPGYRVAGGWWLTNARLAPATSYEVTARVAPARHRGKLRARNERWTFTTVTPAAALGARVTPGDGDVVGVGMPISVRFTGPVVNRAAVEQRLLVTTSVPVAGTWHWMNDHEVHWRPRDYWPAHTDVRLNVDLEGVAAGNGVFGNVHRTSHFTIGDAHVSVADASTHMLTVFENGVVVKTFPMSAGRDEYPTMSGRHLVLGKQTDVLMDSRTNGIPLESPDGYYEHVYWDTQISTTGEYVHAAPWSVRSQGRRNVSHGCVNLATENAVWFFVFSRRGDVVEVLGTPRGPNNDAAMVDWKVPFDQWVQGSALYSTIPPPRTRVA